MVRPQRPDYVGHDPGSLKEMRGPEGVKQYVATTHAAFANLRIHSRGPAAEGDGVATQYTFSGTHRDELMGIPPTGNRVPIAGIAEDRISGGKIEESWDDYDALGMMQQLGVMPAPEQAEA